MSDGRNGMVSGSAMPQLAQCNKSGQMQQGMPNPSSPEAEVGNTLHDAMAGIDVTLTHDEADLVRRMKEHEITVRMLVFGTDPVYEVKREERLWSRTKKFSGRIDLIMIDGGTALVLDYKTGRVPVKAAEDNWQLKAYAVLVATHWPVERVFVSIVQPHCGEPTVYKYNKAALRKASRQIHALIRKSNNPKAKLNPSESACKYCRAKPICPALQGEALEMARVSNNGVARFSGSQLAMLLDQVKPVEAFVKALKAEAKKLLEKEEGSVPGYYLTQGGRRRKITENKKVYSVLADSGVSFDDILSCITFSVAKIERLTRDREGGSAHEARELVEEALGNLIEVSESESKLEKEVKDAKQNIKG